MNNLENSFKDALTDFDQISPSSGLWNRISTTLFLKSAGFKISAITLLILLIVGIPSYFYNSKTENLNTKTSIAKTNLQSIQKEAIISESTPIAKNVNNTPSTSINSSNKSKPEQKTTNVNNTKAQAPIHANTTTNQKKIQKNKTDKQYNNTALPVSENQNTAQVAMVAPTAKPKTISAQETAIQEDQTDHIRSSTDKFAETNSSKVEQINSVESFSDYSISATSFESNSDFKFITLSQNRIRFHNELEVFAGPNIAFSIIETDDKAFENTVDLRTTNETPKLSFHFGLNYKTYYNKWFISMGINYHQIEDHASYSVLAYDVDSVMSTYSIYSTNYNRVITGYIPNPNDTTSNIPVYDIIVSQDTTIVNTMFYDSTQTTKAVSFTNSYSYIEIPFSIGREFNYRNFVFDISGGVSYGRLIKSVVNIPNEQGNALLSNQEIESIIIKNTFSGIMGLGIAYRMNEGSLLFIRPEIRYNLNSMFNKEYPISQKYLQIRTSIGIRISL